MCTRYAFSRICAADNYGRDHCHFSLVAGELDYAKSPPENIRALSSVV